jgi:hypothetical protein
MKYLYILFAIMVASVAAEKCSSTHTGNDDNYVTTETCVSKKGTTVYQCTVNGSHAACNIHGDITMGACVTDDWHKGNGQGRSCCYDSDDCQDTCEHHFCK